MITDAQVLVLRRMCSGTEYQLRGDKSKGREVGRILASCNRCYRNCRSLAPLMRAGLIEFETQPNDLLRYYRVRLTARARMYVRE